MRDATHIPDQSFIRGFEKFDMETIRRLASTVRMNVYDHQVTRMPEQHISGYVLNVKIRVAPPVIHIAESEPIWRRSRTYLHEACHLISARYDIDEDPTGIAHNRFFAVLVAVCYRRVNSLKSLQVYEFADTLTVINGEAQGPGAMHISDDELIERFRFIVRESARYARTDWSIERIAQHLASRYFREDGSYHDPSSPKPISQHKPLVPAWLAISGSAGLSAVALIFAWHSGFFTAFGG
ncbi:hypothetical protein [Burkholderia ubonensis]|uniref:hypothetical protein n=1 Tax=Burkholderia ubonensis TaxID=101571 RepID=UPI000A490931|nr:hypothetical protein [Burkholderia ubonensis]